MNTSNKLIFTLSQYHYESSSSCVYNNDITLGEGSFTFWKNLNKQLNLSPFILLSQC